jgi:hypothetical protein
MAFCLDFGQIESFIFIPYLGGGTSNGGFIIASRNWPTSHRLWCRFDILNGTIRQTTLPLHDVGHDISSTSLFIGMEFSPLNRFQGKIGCRLFNINPTSSRNLISSWVTLVSTWTCQIFETTYLMHICILYHQWSDSYHLHRTRTYVALRVHQGTKSTTLSKSR